MTAAAFRKSNHTKEEIDEIFAAVEANCRAGARDAASAYAGVVCPRCGTKIIETDIGTSFELQCETPGCFYAAFRGI